MDLYDYIYLAMIKIFSEFITLLFLIFKFSVFIRNDPLLLFDQSSRPLAPHQVVFIKSKPNIKTKDSEISKVGLICRSINW